jgi:hypothetical protein
MENLLIFGYGKLQMHHNNKFILLIEHEMIDCDYSLQFRIFRKIEHFSDVDMQ